MYTTYATSDIDNFYENDGSVLDMYSENPTATVPYNYSIATTQRCGNYTTEGDCYNREHIIPQSVFNKQSPMVSDAHFIVPTDGYVNNIRNNFPHSNVAVPIYTSQNGSKRGESTTAGYTGLVFEPIDEFKGDIARMYFYFATRYENTVAGYSYAMFKGTSDKVFTPAFLSVLIAWHNQDPVNAREIARNNAIYARQNNRNPYIDHPEYVQAIWNPVADTQAPTAASNLAVTGTTSSTVSFSWTAGTDNVALTSYDIYMNGVIKTSVPGLTTTIMGLTASTTYSFYVIAKDASVNSSPASNTVNGTTTIFIPDTETPTAPTNLAVTGSSSSTVSLNWSASTDNVGIASYAIYVNNVFKQNATSTTAIITGLTPSTTYSFYIIAKDTSNNLSVGSTSVDGSTSASTGGGTIASEIFFSEYVEGSSNNKFLEISNFTGSTVDLTKYAIKKQINGAGAWTSVTGLVLTGTIANGASYVIAYNQGLTTCFNPANANLSSGAAELQFNGNDPIGLFKENVLIDVIGTFGNTADFSVDETIRRKATISSPNTTFNKTAEWDVYAKDKCDGLGSHTLKTLSTEDFDSKNFTIHPNPANNHFIVDFQGGDASFSVAIYSILGQKVFEKQNTNNKTVEFQNLSKGTYILKITKDSKTLTRKLLVN